MDGEGGHVVDVHQPDTGRLPVAVGQDGVDIGCRKAIMLSDQCMTMEKECSDVALYKSAGGLQQRNRA